MWCNGVAVFVCTLLLLLLLLLVVVVVAVVVVVKQFSSCLSGCPSVAVGCPLIAFGPLGGRMVMVQRTWATATPLNICLYIWCHAFLSVRQHEHRQSVFLSFLLSFCLFFLSFISSFFLFCLSLSLSRSLSLLPCVCVCVSEMPDQGGDKSAGPLSRVMPRSPAILLRINMALSQF